MDKPEDQPVIRTRELAPLLTIGDSYPLIVLLLDSHDVKHVDADDG